MNNLERTGARDVVEHEDNMNIINGTWAFKYKQFPNGTVMKFKACFVLVVISSCSYCPMVHCLPDAYP
ncbi:hypothetical protein ACHAXS_001775 [Conticribra weissflogii]